MIAIQQIFHKIREICESCYEGSQDHIKIPRNYKTITLGTSSDKSKQISQSIIKQYLLSLDHLHQYLIELKQFKIQYQNLESALQKQQTEIRKHISIEQQLRIYTDGLKVQYQQSQNQRLQLLQNSKNTIKSLKLRNQQLFQQVTMLKKKIEGHQKLGQKTFQNSRIKTKIKDKSRSGSADRKDSSLKKIIKTQYIERQKHPFLNLNIKRQLKFKNQGLQGIQKKHKHHKSTFAAQNPRNSSSKKKHKKDTVERSKKQKLKHSNSKNFEMGVGALEPKKSPFKIDQKSQHKVQSHKIPQKHNKSSLNEDKAKQKGYKNDKQWIKQAKRQRLNTYGDIVENYINNRKQIKKQIQKSRQSKKRLKGKDQIKKQIPKKTFHHNRSVFSVSSMEYKTQGKQKQK